MLLGDALADAAALRVVAVDFARDEPGTDTSAADIITIEVLDESDSTGEVVLAVVDEPDEPDGSADQN